MAAIWEVIVNYLFIQGAILLFIAPFYLVYHVKTPGTRLSHLAFNDHIRNFLSSSQANALVFTWAAAEAVAWFVIPEFLLLLVIFLRVQRKSALLIADIAGTAFGTIVGLVVAQTTPFSAVSAPYISPAMVDQVSVWYQQLGVFGLLFQPFSGIPYKVFVLTVHNFPINLIGFAVIALIVRIGRYALLYLIFVGLYPFLHRFVSRHYLPIVAVSCLVFTWLFLHVYHGYGPEHVVNEQSGQAVQQSLEFLRKILGGFF